MRAFRDGPDWSTLTSVSSCEVRLNTLFVSYGKPRQNLGSFRFVDSGWREGRPGPTSHPFLKPTAPPARLSCSVDRTSDTIALVIYFLSIKFSSVLAVVSRSRPSVRLGHWYFSQSIGLCSILQALPAVLHCIATTNAFYDKDNPCQKASTNGPSRFRLQTSALRRGHFPSSRSTVGGRNRGCHPDVFVSAEPATRTGLPRNPAAAPSTTGGRTAY